MPSGGGARVAPGPSSGLGGIDRSLLIPRAKRRLDRHRLTRTQPLPAPDHDPLAGGDAVHFDERSLCDSGGDGDPLGDSVLTDAIDRGAVPAQHQRVAGNRGDGTRRRARDRHPHVLSDRPGFVADAQAQFVEPRLVVPDRHDRLHRARGPAGIGLERELPAFTDEGERGDRDPGLDLERVGVDEAHHRLAALRPLAALPEARGHHPTEGRLDLGALQALSGEGKASPDRAQLAAGDVALRDGFVEAVAGRSLLSDQGLEPLDLRVEIGEPGLDSRNRRLVLRELLSKQCIIEPGHRLAFRDRRANLGDPIRAGPALRPRPGPGCG